MIEFTELPKDGDRFEQLVRELLMLDGMQPRWTGRGPDDGRDLLVDEELAGPLARFQRRWLVQCKHFAHNGRSVGRDDVGNFARDCRQAGARGYLLACSTVPSAGLVRLLDETAKQESIAVLIWDNVYIERRLLRPDAFRTAHQFFPRSMAAAPWQLVRVEAGASGGASPTWAAHYKDDLVYLACRMTASYPSLSDVAAIIEKVRGVDVLGPEEQLRVRAVYFDEKNWQYSAYVDYMLPSKRYDAPEQVPTCAPSELLFRLGESVDVPVLVAFPRDSMQSEFGDADGGTPSVGHVIDPTLDPIEEYWDTDRKPVHWHMRVVRYSPHSDHYDPTHHDYYPESALRAFALGSEWGALIEDHVHAGDWLRVDVNGERAQEDELIAALLQNRRERTSSRVGDAGS